MADDDLAHNDWRYRKVILKGRVSNRINMAKIKGRGAELGYIARVRKDCSQGTHFFYTQFIYFSKGISSYLHMPSLNYRSRFSRTPNNAGRCNKGEEEGQRLHCPLCEREICHFWSTKL